MILNLDIDKLTIFQHDIRYTAYANDLKIFGEKSKHFLVEILNVFYKFSKISGYKPNKSIHKIVGKGALKEIKVPCNETV